MNKKIIVIGSCLITIILFLTGCFETINKDDGTITYKSQPTKVQYTISYGYKVDCNGDGQYSINYDCDVPEVLRGKLLSYSANDEGYVQKTVASHNTVESWEITSTEEESYDLGITATVISESFVVSDLNGENALDIAEIGQQFPDIVTQYTNTQADENKVYIDPTDENIKQIATDILENAETNNSFQIAKLMFIWLKEHTTYKIHNQGENIVQSAIETLQLKTGDCDDITFLYLSLLRSIDIPARFIRGFLVEEDEAISHAWAEVFVGGNLGNSGWIPVECAGTSTDIETEINQNFATKSAEKLRLFKGDGSDEAIIESLSGLSYSTSSQDIEIDAEAYVVIQDYQVLEEGQLIIDENGDRYFK